MLGKYPERSFTTTQLMLLTSLEISTTAKAKAKVFSAKIIFFTNSRKFSPSKVSRYTVSTRNAHNC